MQQPTDITQPVRSLCEALGLDANLVRDIHITPTTARIEVYKTRDGKKYMEFPTGDTWDTTHPKGEPATEIKTFDVHA